MGLRFEALEPSYATSGTAPTHRVQFIDDSNGTLTDPDSVESLEVYDNNQNLLRTFLPPDIVNPNVGEYFVNDQVINDQGVYFLRWEYIYNGNTIQVTSAFEVVDEVEGLPEAEMKDYVLSMLGKGVMNVALPAGTLDFCLNQAELWFAVHVGQKKRKRVTLQNSQTKYDVADDCYYVVDVALPGNFTRVADALGAFGVYGFSQLGLSDIPVEDLFGQGGSQGFYGSLVQSLSYAEMGRRVLSSAASWEWMPYERKLYLFPAPDVSGDMVVDYVSSEIDFSKLDPRSEYFLRQRTLAEAKEALGRIRSKFSSFPSADGDFQIDGSQLLSEAQDEKMRLDEKIHYYSPSGWIITG